MNTPRNKKSSLGLAAKENERNINSIPIIWEISSFSNDLTLQRGIHHV